MYLPLKVGDHVRHDDDGLIHHIITVNKIGHDAATGETLSSRYTIACLSEYQVNLGGLDYDDPRLAITAQPLTCLGCLAAERKA